MTIAGGEEEGLLEKFISEVYTAVEAKVVLGRAAINCFCDFASFDTYIMR